MGYANILPLKTGTDKIKRLLGDITTVDITPDDIVEFRPGMHTDLYVMSIGVRPNDDITEKHNLGSHIISGLRRLLIDFGRKGAIIESIVGRNETPDGIRLMRHIRFTEIEPLLPGKRAFIITVEESGIPLIMQYKEALRESKATEE